MLLHRRPAEFQRLHDTKGGDTKRLFAAPTINTNATPVITLLTRNGDDKPAGENPVKQ